MELLTRLMNIMVKQPILTIAVLSGMFSFFWIGYEIPAEHNEGISPALLADALREAFAHFAIKDKGR